MSLLEERMRNSAEQIVDRKEQKELLREILSSDKAEFVALFGRRRVGKTYLIKTFFKQTNCMFFHVTGSNNDSMATQIQRFVSEIGVSFYNNAELKPPKKWADVFEQLTKAIASVPKNMKIVLFFDELPWMATRRSKLIQAVDYYWNRYWVDDKRLKLVICGSSASWIIKNIVNNKGGLHNRITQLIELRPFNLNGTREFLKYRGINFNNKQILQLYLVTGGIPHYLNNIKKGVSATQSIDSLCFRRDGILYKEFKNLFSSLFDNADIYVDLVRIIAKHRYGISQEEIIKQHKNVSRGGRIVRRLKDLEEAGFIISFIPYLHKQKGVYYRIFDEYTLFYLDWIEPTTRTIQKLEEQKKYWESKSNTASWKAWSGYAFESICYKHIANIRGALKINAAAEVGNWRYSPRKLKCEDRAQIDLLFDRNDDSITICEIKYTDTPFAIDKQYTRNLANKINIFKKVAKIDKQVFIAMISANGLKPTIYSEELISGVVTLDDLFEE
jgi:uncharacterized protein